MYLKSNLWLFFPKLSAVRFCCLSFLSFAWTARTIKYSEHNFNIPYFAAQRWEKERREMKKEEKKNKFIVLCLDSALALSRGGVRVDVKRVKLAGDVIADTHKMKIKIWFHED